MDLGLVLVCYFDRSWEEALDAVVAQGLRYVEPCGGGHIPKVHYDPQRLAADSDALAEFRESITSRGLEICALATHGNPVHPDPDRARAHHDDFVASCKIAAEPWRPVPADVSGRELHDRRLLRIDGGILLMAAQANQFVGSEGAG